MLRHSPSSLSPNRTKSTIDDWRQLQLTPHILVCALSILKALQLGITMQKVSYKSSSSSFISNFKSLAKVLLRYNSFCKIRQWNTVGTAPSRWVLASLSHMLTYMLLKFILYMQ